MVNMISQKRHEHELKRHAKRKLLYALARGKKKGGKVCRKAAP